MLIIRQSTARTVTVGPVLDADGVAVTDRVIGNFKLAKNGGAPAAFNASATLTHRHTGHYSLAMTTSDTDTVGQSEIVIDDTVNACPAKELTVIEEAVYDALFAASAPGYIANALVRLADGVEHGGTTARLRLGSTSAANPPLKITQSDGTAVDIQGTEDAFFVTGSGGNAIKIQGGGNGAGMYITGAGAGSGMHILGGSSNGAGVVMRGAGTFGIGLWLDCGVVDPDLAAGLYIKSTIVAETTKFVGVVTATAGITANITGNLIGTVSTLTTYTGNTPQTGDSFARIGATGSGLTSLAPSATALSTVQWTNARSGYLDNLNIGGNVASSTEVTAIQNNTRVVRVVPEDIELPAAGTRTYRVELFLYDDAGGMEAPDSAPTIALVNQAGTDRSGRLDSTTMALVETGRYRAIYTSTAGDTKEQLVWAFNVVEGGATRKYGNTSYVTDAVATDFTSADRAKLDTLHDTRIPGVIQPQTGDAFARIGANGAGLTALGDARIANLDAAITSRMASYTQPTGFLTASFPTDPADQSLVIAATDAILTAVNTKASQASVDDLPTNAELATALADADNAILAAIAALNNLSAVQAKAQADAALADIHLDHLLAVDYDPANKPGVATALLNELIESDAGVSRYTVNALEQAPAGGGGGGGTDWSSDERTQIRKALGITGSVAATTGSGIVDSILALLQAAGLTITVSNPVPANGGTIRLVKGDDYHTSLGNALSWNVETIINLLTSVVSFIVYEGEESEGIELNVTCSSTSISGGYTVTATLTAAQTLGLSRGEKHYEVIAVTSGGLTKTLVEGDVTVRE